MFSRQSPSPRYQELLRQNRQLHLEGNPAQKVSAEDSFPGKSLFRQLPRIRNLVRATKASSLLDYGCGKGLQYQANRIFIDGNAVEESVQDYLGDFEQRIAALGANLLLAEYRGYGMLSGEPPWPPCWRMSV